MKADSALERTLARRLRRVVRGDVLTDPASLQRYAADPFATTELPAAVLLPVDGVDVTAALALARELGVGVRARGAATDRYGAASGPSLIIDTSRHLTGIRKLDRQALTVEVEPGVIAARLDALLAPHGLCLPVDLLSADQATLGGMVGSNAIGIGAARHGAMVHQVLAIDALLADGTEQRFGPFGTDAGKGAVALQSGRAGRLVSGLFEIADRERGEIDRHWPRVLRRPDGYNLDVFHPRSLRPYTPDGSVNLAHLLVGSAGTLAFSQRLTLQLVARPVRQGYAVVDIGAPGHGLPMLRAMTALRPDRLVLLSDGLLESARAEPHRRVAVERFFGAAAVSPGRCRLVFGFDGEDESAVASRLSELSRVAAASDVVVLAQGVCGEEGRDDQALRALLRLAATALGSRSPGVRLSLALPPAAIAGLIGLVESLAAAQQVQTRWFGPVEAGCLELALLAPQGATTVGPTATEAGLAALASLAALADAIERETRALGGSVRRAGDPRAAGATSAAGYRVDAQIYGPKLAQAFETVRARFDPDGLFGEPATTVRASVSSVRVMDLRHDTGSAADSAARCDGNGFCRAAGPGMMCPSFRATGQERDSPRGRARTIQQAGSLLAPAVAEAMALCVGCKACRVECPNSVDLASVRLELAAQTARAGLRSRARQRLAALPEHLDRLARLPRPFRRVVLALLGRVGQWRARSPGFARWVERRTGLAAGVAWPLPALQRYSSLATATAPATVAGADRRDVVLWADTYHDHFEPRVLQAAERVLLAGGYRVHHLRPQAGDATPSRPLCCGRSWLTGGDEDRARDELRRLVAAGADWQARGVPIVGLEPSCLLGLRDDAQRLGVTGLDALAGNTWLLAEFLDREMAAGRFAWPVLPSEGRAARLRLQGHCHERFGVAAGVVERVLARLTGQPVERLPANCCGMAETFGHEPGRVAASRAMARQLLQAVEQGAAADDVLVSDGCACRQQIRSLSTHRPRHLAEVLDEVLAEAPDGVLAGPPKAP